MPHGSYEDVVIPTDRRVSLTALRRLDTNLDADALEKARGSMASASSTQPRGSIPETEFQDPRIDKPSRIDKTLKEIEVDGWRSLYRAHSLPGRIFWLTVSVLCLSLLLYELVAVFVNYYTRPLSTSYQIVNNESMYFPEIRVCPLNSLNWTFLNEHKPFLTHAYQIKQISGIVDYDAHGQTAKPMNLTLTDSYEKFMQLGYQLEEFMPACGFTSSFSNYLNCTSVATPRWDAAYGKCFTVSLANLTQTTPGSGLLMTLNLNKKHFPTLPLFAPVTDGVEIKMGDERVLLRPGSRYHIEIRAERLRFVNVERGKVSARCVGEGKHAYEYGVINRGRDDYNQRDCIRDCYVREQWDICKCLPIINPSEVQPQILNNTDHPVYLCDANRTAECVRPLIDNDPIVRSRVERCKSRCYIPCDFTRYQMKVSDAPLNPLGFQSLLELYNASIDNFITIELAYPSLDYTEFGQDISKSFDELVSDIGGQIGLWMGASMVTIIQIPFALTTLCMFSSMKKAVVVRGAAAKYYARRFTRPQI